MTGYHIKTHIICEKIINHTINGFETNLQYLFQSNLYWVLPTVSTLVKS